MFIVSEKVNVWFSRFPYFKVNFCSELQWICHEKRNGESAFNCAILSSYSEQIHCKNSMQFCTLKLGNLENQTFAFSLIIFTSPSIISKQILIIRFRYTISGTVLYRTVLYVLPAMYCTLCSTCKKYI